jgi:hypothetical protein
VYKFDKKIMRKLNYDILESSDGNVTLGFKINSSLKLHLAQTAQKAGLSLSKYVSDIVATYPVMLRRLEEENLEAKKKLARFESPELATLFEECKGQTAHIKDATGHTKSIIINSIYDLHQVMTKSFKNK